MQARSALTVALSEESAWPQLQALQATPSLLQTSSAPRPMFTGPMDEYLSDNRVEAAVNRAGKSIKDNPADLESELRAFAKTGEDWRLQSKSPSRPRTPLCLRRRTGS